MMRLRRVQQWYKGCVLPLIPTFPVLSTGDSNPRFLSRVGIFVRIQLGSVCYQKKKKKRQCLHKVEVYFSYLKTRSRVKWSSVGMVASLSC